MNPFFFGSRGRGIFRFLRIFLHFPNFIRLTIRLFRDERVPIYRKAILVIFQILAGAFAIAYLVFPFDLIFDFLPLPLVGRFDDIVIGALIILLPGAWLFIKSCPEHIVREHVNKISRGE
ncbi:MAG: DUF1232 domain-containing protein [Candidatus Poribacteria bacterium]|nr:DUF1232 domain-containing protein [Candidatus Poribacteria bacterium]